MRSFQDWCLLHKLSTLVTSSVPAFLPRLQTQISFLTFKCPAQCLVPSRCSMNLYLINQQMTKIKLGVAIHSCVSGWPLMDSPAIDSPIFLPTHLNLFICHCSILSSTHPLAVVGPLVHDVSKLDHIWSPNLPSSSCRIPHSQCLDVGGLAGASSGCCVRRQIS